MMFSATFEIAMQRVAALGDTALNDGCWGMAWREPVWVCVKV